MEIAVIATLLCMSRNYKINNPEGIYYLTFVTVEWVDVFTRKEYKDVLVESLRYCQENKGLKIYSWVVMSNHVHLIASSDMGDLSGTIRDFKKYTSMQMLRKISNNRQESRKDWMLHIFKTSGQANSQNKYYQFWRQNNQPKELLPYQGSFTEQKLDYIHNNPVAEGIVENPEHYLYSSARDYAGGKGLIDVEYLE